MSCLRWPDIWGVDGDMIKVSAETIGGVGCASVQQKLGWLKRGLRTFDRRTGRAPGSIAEGATMRWGSGDAAVCLLCRQGPEMADTEGKRPFQHNRFTSRSHGRIPFGW